MNSGGADTGDALRTSVAALRLLVEGWRDGIVDAQPGTRDGDQLQLHVRAVSTLVARMTPVVERPASRP